VSQGGHKFPWATVILRDYREVPEFWERDAGLVCLGFRELGIDARFVALGQPIVRDDLPLILARREQLEDANWWAKWELTGVVVWGWYSNDRIATAIKASGAVIAYHLDIDGLLSSHVDFWRYLRRSCQMARDERRFAPALRALAKTLIFHFVPARYDLRVLQLCGHASLLTVNSPLAGEQFRRFALKFKRPDLAARTKLIPSPVPRQACLDPALIKRRQIVAVGRWAAYQKDAPLLMEVLGRVLEARPEWSAALCGTGADYLHRLAKDLPASAQRRVLILGYVERAKLIQLYQESRIMLVTSRYESLHLPAVEALCCGASIVGPAQITSINYLASASSGTLAISRSATNLADALFAEIAAWENAQRLPAAISAYWRERFASDRYVSRILECLGMDSKSGLAK
jgi:glycosyltransferase involved in cell wall biosynthesis